MDKIISIHKAENPFLKLDSDIKLVAMDIDGVLTNGKLYYSENNFIGREYDSKDGMAIRLLQSKGIKIAWISGGFGSSIQDRAKDLDIKYCFTSIKEKDKILKDTQEKLNISIKETIFLGDDINDIVVKPYCNFFLCPKDANEAAKDSADWIGNSNGGCGFVREVTDYLLLKMGVTNASGWASLN